ncbi:TAXI family TRAP transporter solute-binding subunit [Pseudaeromonas sharmana]|uniref:TAXI family TRAP transporter solute-binding subunit n=1 Tax=Pseudaeromonas sharmana TaxID=328412 RepID=A0ABV8CNK2_9GAMM
MHFYATAQLALAMTIALVLPPQALAAPVTQLVIGTGSVTGVYYPAGGAICRLINKNQKERTIRCSVLATEGSISNLHALDDNQINLAIVQSDAQLAYLRGSGEFSSKGANPHLRSLFSLYVEPLTIVARKDSDINGLTDLLGKRLDIGNPGSGDRSTMELLMQAEGWAANSFASVSELKGAERAQALCDNQFDAFVYVVGHPSGTIKEASGNCDINLVPVADDTVTKLLEEHPEYTKTIIPGRLYRGVDKDIPSFGVVATVVTTDTLSENIAYAIVNAIFSNFEQFKRLHPAFSTLNRKNMVIQGLTAPLHPGALKYYQEVGLVTREQQK